MSKELVDLGKKVATLDKTVDNLGKKMSKVNVHLQRIENKVNHIINFLEEFLVADTSEDYDDEDDFDTDETWVPDPDAWKQDNDIEDE